MEILVEQQEEFLTAGLNAAGWKQVNTWKLDLRGPGDPINGGNSLLFITGTSKFFCSQEEYSWRNWKGSSYEGPDYDIGVFCLTEAGDQIGWGSNFRIPAHLI